MSPFNRNHHAHPQVLHPRRSQLDDLFHGVSGEAGTVHLPPKAHQGTKTEEEAVAEGLHAGLEGEVGAQDEAHDDV